jgi:hypothetical protein
MNPDELLMGALPYMNYSQPSSMTISTGGGGNGSVGVDVGPSSEMGGTVAVAEAKASTGMAVLVTWFILLFILIAVNVITLKIQR